MADRGVGIILDICSGSGWGDADVCLLFTGPGLPAHPPSSEVGMLTFNGKTIKKNLKSASRSMKEFRPQLSLWLVKQTLLMSTAVN